ncbi:AsmA family protein [Thiomicrorhabdus sp. ZW0627]|uniref:AsmA family protein n=1 Tax=Thiomicrorhabdus sp. ZW0627 TaxID=3039774 RepID=UPI0024373321|nr:AsmA family protein [Thiomicrorhabdus sp. ZW0627]MDG6774358.1 AsmA family protein [Thiomicrorhabdus sp. ZW0627]
MSSHDDTKPISSENMVDTEAPVKANHTAKLLKWSSRLTMVGAIIPILLFLGFAAAISLIDFNQYKPQIEQEVAQRSGHELKIDGSIEVSMFPFTFSIGDVALKNEPVFAEEFGQPNLMSIKQVRVEVSLWDLFIHKQLSIVGLELVEPSAVLLIDKHGNNWHRLAQRIVPGSKFAEATVQRRFANATLEDLPKLFRVAQDPAIGNAQKKAVPTAEDLTGDAMTGATPSDSNAKTASMTDTETGDEEGLFRWHFDSVVVTKGHFEVQDSVVNHQAVISDLNLMAFDVTLGKPFQVRTDFAYHNTLRERHYEFDLTTYLDINKEFSRWRVTDWQGVFKLKLPEKYKVPEMRLVTKGKEFSLNLIDNQIQVNQAQLDALGSRITTSFSGQYGGEANLYGAMTVNGINVQSWGRHLGVKMPEFVNPKALTQVKGQVDWMLSEDKLDLNNVELTWDNSTLKGQLWHKSSPESEYAFDFTLDKLNLDDYRAYSTLLPKQPKASAQKQVPADKSESPAKPVEGDVSKRETYLPLAVPISTLRALKADGKLVVGELVASGVKMQDLTMELHAEKGKLQLAPFDAKLYQGQLASKLGVDVNGSTPAFRWQGKLQQVDVAALSQDGWQKRPLDGRMSSTFNLGTLGSNPQALTQNMNGDLNLTLNDGHFYGVDVDKLLAGQAVSENDKMPYDNIQIQGSVRQGVFKSKQLSVKTPNFKGSGSGALDLNKSTIDTSLKVLVTNPPKSLRHLKGMRVPIRYQGPLEQAEWSVNLQSLLNDPGNQQKLVNQLKALLQ